MNVVLATIGPFPRTKNRKSEHTEEHKIQQKQRAVRKAAAEPEERGRDQQIADELIQSISMACNDHEHQH